METGSKRATENAMKSGPTPDAGDIEALRFLGTDGGFAELDGDPALLPWLSVHPASGSDDAPAFLVLPGGGYQRHADHEGEPVADWLNSLGIHAVVLRYRVASTRHPEPLLDARSALAWIRSGGTGLSVDPHRVGVLGFSAGGHLAATLSTGASAQDIDADQPDSRPDLAVLCYPVVSFVREPHPGSVQQLLGASPDEAELEELSADLRVDDLTPPTFLWHTADDTAVPVSHSLGYAGALAARSIPVELHVFPHGRHGLGLAAEEPAVGQWPELCGRWLADHGWTTGG